MKNGKSDCPFCSEEVIKRIIFSNQDAFAIYDQYPVSKGHILIIPNRHCDNYFFLTSQEQGACWDLVNKMQDKISKEFHTDGFNLGINVGKAAGQTVDHVHIHLIPRYSGDMKDPRGGIRHCVEGKGYY